MFLYYKIVELYLALCSSLLYTRTSEFSNVVSNYPYISKHVAFACTEYSQIKKILK